MSGTSFRSPSGSPKREISEPTQSHGLAALRTLPHVPASAILTGIIETTRCSFTRGDGGRLTTSGKSVFVKDANDSLDTLVTEVRDRVEVFAS